MFEQIHQTTTQQLRYINFPRSRDEVSLDQSSGGDSDAPTFRNSLDLLYIPNFTAHFLAL